ncbi:bromodomain-containing protein 4-like [Venturia canescens]|uniref:bromodomain-containing protein 4-like n=1 Tax=Venturia canescens TaxID=32260 RepID=UPI001C9D4392|nr:bromodomain-containing protein 4-like [Venturia canescens]
MTLRPESPPGSLAPLGCTIPEPQSSSSESGTLTPSTVAQSPSPPAMEVDPADTAEVTRRLTAVARMLAPEPDPPKRPQPPPPPFPSSAWPPLPPPAPFLASEPSSPPRRTSPLNSLRSPTLSPIDKAKKKEQLTWGERMNPSPTKVSAQPEEPSPERQEPSRRPLTSNVTSDEQPHDSERLLVGPPASRLHPGGYPSSSQHRHGPSRKSHVRETTPRHFTPYFRRRISELSNARRSEPLVVVHPPAAVAPLSRTSTRGAPRGSEIEDRVMQFATVAPIISPVTRGATPRIKNLLSVVTSPHHTPIQPRVQALFLSPPCPLPPNTPRCAE